MSTLQDALRARRIDFLACELMLFLLPEDNEMNLETLKAMPTKDLIDLYNDLKGKSVKRFSTRKAAEARIFEALKEEGKWEGKEPAGMAAGATSKKAKGKATKDKPAGAKVKPEKAPAKKKTAGAPVKNQTYTPIGEKSKAYNPDGLRFNASSARAKVLDFITTKGSATREQVEKKFEGEDVNVTSALYILSRYGFIKVAE